MRIKLIRLLIIGLFLMIVSTLVYVQVIRGQYYYRLSTNNRIRVVPLEGWRGRILDRDGAVLADNRLAFNAMVIPQEIQKEEELFAFLSRVLEMDPARLEKLYRNKRTASFIPVVVAEDISKHQAMVIEENRYRYPSLLIQESYKRIYPQGRNSAHLLGYVGKVNRQALERFKEYGYSPQSVIGYSGVEEYYNSYLKGDEGGVQIEVDSRGRQVRLLSLKEATKGQDISLTIDADIQQMAAEVMEGKVGSVIVMDSHNGEILGLMSAPDFDANVFVNPEMRDQLRTVSSDKDAPLINRAIRGTFPPASVFKVIVALGGLDLGKITGDTSFFCPGFYELGGIRFGCTHKHGSQNLIESVAHSCNVYYYRMGLLMGADMIHHYAELFGLGKPTHVDLPYEKAGNIPSRRGARVKGGTWYSGNTLNMSIGQGDVLTTPLQLTRMMATVANMGKDVPPHVIRSISGRPVEQYNYSQNVELPRKHYDLINKGLRATVAQYSGTAHVLDIPGLYVAGKTGTAQSSPDKEDHAWFVGYVRNQDRQLAFSVFLEHGGSSHNACLVARQLLLQMQGKKLI